MKARSWILLSGFIVALAIIVIYGQFGLSSPDVKHDAAPVRMGDFRRVEYQQAIPVTGGSESRVGMGDLREFENLVELPVTGASTDALRVRMADLRALEFRQDIRMGIGDLRKLEANQNRTVGMGDLQRFDAGQ